MSHEGSTLTKTVYFAHPHPPEDHEFSPTAWTEYNNKRNRIFETTAPTTTSTIYTSEDGKVIIENRPILHATTGPGSVLESVTRYTVSEGFAYPPIFSGVNALVYEEHDKGNIALVLDQVSQSIRLRPTKAVSSTKGRFHRFLSVCSCSLLGTAEG
jgi:hypothetical protein